MIPADDLPRLRENPSSALLAVVDELALSIEGFSGFIELILDRGDGRSKTVSLPRQGVAEAMEPLLWQFRAAHALLDATRRQLYPPKH